MGLALCVASATFLLLLGQTISSRLNAELFGRGTFGISWLFFGYLLLSLAFIVLIGMVSVSYLVSAMINQRMKDIAVIKAVGSLPRRLFAYAMTETVLVVLGSCTVGGLSALILYISWTRDLLQFSQVAVLTLTGVPMVSFLLSFLAARVHVRRVINTSSISAISSELSTLNWRGARRPVHIKRFGSAFSLARKTLSRDRQFGKTMIRVSVCIFLATVVFTGALVSWDTSKSYVERAMPPHILMIGTPQMVSHYAQLAGSFSTTTFIPPVDYLNDSQLIQPELGGTIREIVGVETVDTRLVIMSTVSGYVKAHFAPGTELSGDRTTVDIIPEVYLGSTRVLIIGVAPNQTAGNWFTTDGFLEDSDPQTTMVAGDSLVGGIVRMPLNLSEVGAFGTRFNVKSALVDPLNQGRVLYAPLGSLQKILRVTSYNIFLVEFNEDPTTLSRIQQVASENGLVVQPLDPLLASNIAFLDNSWSHILVFPVLTLILTSGIWLSYLTTNYSKWFNDYVVIKVLGAGKRYTLKLLLWEGWGTMAVCMTIAIPLGFMFTTFLLIPEPMLLAQKLILSAIVLVSGPGAACAAASWYYSRKLKTTTVKDLKT